MVGPVEVRLGTQGRLVLPRELREALGAEEGAVYVARIEDGVLVLESRERVLARLRAHASEADASAGSWVEELIEERRETARREADPG